PQTDHRPTPRRHALTETDCPTHKQLSTLFFNDTPTTEIYTFSLHDALPICVWLLVSHSYRLELFLYPELERLGGRSGEHTSELQSHLNLVCRLLLLTKQ